MSSSGWSWTWNGGPGPNNTGTSYSGFPPSTSNSSHNSGGSSGGSFLPPNAPPPSTNTNPDKRQKTDNQDTQQEQEQELEEMPGVVPQVITSSKFTFDLTHGRKWHGSSNKNGKIILMRGSESAPLPVCCNGLKSDFTNTVGWTNGTYATTQPGNTTTQWAKAEWPVFTYGSCSASFGSAANTWASIVDMKAQDVAEDQYERAGLTNLIVNESQTTYKYGFHKINGKLWIQNISSSTVVLDIYPVTPKHDTNASGGQYVSTSTGTPNFTGGTGGLLTLVNYKQGLNQNQDNLNVQATPFQFPLYVANFNIHKPEKVTLYPGQLHCLNYSVLINKWYENEELHQIGLKGAVDGFMKDLYCSFLFQYHGVPGAHVGGQLVSGAYNKLSFDGTINYCAGLCSILHEWTFEGESDVQFHYSQSIKSVATRTTRGLMLGGTSYPTADAGGDVFTGNNTGFSAFNNSGAPSDDQNPP